MKVAVFTEIWWTFAQFQTQDEIALHLASAAAPGRNSGCVGGLKEMAGMSPEIVIQLEQKEGIAMLS